MKNGRIKYYLTQGKYTSKNAYLVIIGLSIAISMVAGISYFADSYGMHMIESTASNLLDYTFSYETNDGSYFSNLTEEEAEE